MNSADGLVRRSTQPVYQPTVPYAQPQAPNVYGDDSRMPNSHRAPSHQTYFSSQTAFYPPSSQGPVSATNQLISGMGFLATDPFLHVVGQGVRGITERTVNMLPNEMKKSLSSIKCYFAVDQSYVFQKLCLLLFPFRSRKWSLECSADGPVPPRVDSNAPDYYVPLMSALTYVFVAGLALGTQNKFTPEQLGMHATSVLVWNTLEICVLSLIFYIFNVKCKLRTLDLIAYCGYKYVGMIIAVSSYLLTHSLLVYRCTLLYVSLSISYFLIKSLRLQILPETDGSQPYNTDSNKRRIYLLLLIVLLQPVFIWYLTRHLIAI